MEVRRALVDSNTKKFRYFHKSTKKTIKHKKTLLRIKSLKIPPNYRKVKISKSPTSKVQAIGEDTKGRKQYIYHPDFVEEQQEAKFQDFSEEPWQSQFVVFDHQTTSHHALRLWYPFHPEKLE